MNLAQLIEKYKRVIIPFLLGNIYFFSMGHHVIQFWEKPGRVMIGLWVVCVPLLTWVIHMILSRVRPQLKNITPTRLILFIIPALLISGAITWRYYKIPATFNVITITPLVSQNQKVELIEIKVNGNIIPLNEIRALDYGWRKVGDALVGTSTSEPLPVSFKTEIDAPVKILFYSSPEGGKARLSIDRRQIELDLNGSENRQTTSTLYIHSYRGIANWIFTPLLILVDVISIAGLFLFIFFLQETEQSRSSLHGTASPHRSAHRRNITILLVFSGVLHLLNALAVPLLIDADSPSYLEGAFHWLEFGNLDGVSMIRGPGSTFLFTPVILLFSRNPWGIKILLHLLAFACVPLAYRLGWQLGRNQWVAFISGFVTAITPDLFFYSNFVMSDLANLFLVIAFCTLLISALESFEAVWVMGAMLTASFAALFRSENVTLILIGAGVLFTFSLWQWRTIGFAKLCRDLRILAFALMISLLPLLGWSAHNLRVYDYFGLSNYTGEVIYDGWVYFGDASRLDFSDQNSEAVQTIQMVVRQYPIIITDKSGTPTAFEIYPSLIKAGYAPERAIGLLKQAAIDSIKKDWALSFKLLLIKIHASLRPETTAMLSLPLPSESLPSYKRGFFDDEKLSIPALILAQRKTYEYIQEWNDSIYRTWVYVSLFALFFALYRSPGRIWLTLILITVTRIFLPAVIGLSHWRYTLAGWVPLQIIAISCIAMIIQGGVFLFGHQATREA
jgi:4-amino-4-deoxy-L-arabinose transferase-like glycosyltransferase